MNIFLIEDDEAIGMGLKYSLEKEGYNVVLGKSGMARIRTVLRKLLSRP